jgi:hypothetical protein
MPDLDGIARPRSWRVAGGLSNAEIAVELHLGGETMKTHLSSVLLELGARDRTRATQRLNRGRSDTGANSCDLTGCACPAP